MADHYTTSIGASVRTREIDQGLRAHMNKVYGTMSGGMLITALAAWAIAMLATTPDQANGVAQLRNGDFLTQFGYTLFASPLKWVIMFAPLAMVFGFGAVMRRASAAGAQLFFFVFAAVMGLSLSSVFMIYTPVSIVQTFLVTAIAFAGLSLWGYTTNKDLSGMGTFLVMGVIGLIIASIVNIFLGSGTVALVISALGVLIFAGLTAYDTQTIKSEYVAHAHYGDQEWLDKSAIHGALALYLDFINMFQFLLMFLGSEE